jgi:integrase
MKQVVTQALFDAAKPGERDNYISDDRLAGFRLKVTPAGKRVLFYSYRSPVDGSQRKITFKVRNVAEARGLAAQAAAEVARGHDPQAAKDARDAMATVDGAFRDYLDHRVALDKMRAGTRAEYERLMRVSVPETIRCAKPVDVKQSDIAAMMRGLRDRQPLANGILRMLHGFFVWCEGEGGLTPQNSNPCHKVTAYKNRKRSFVFEGDQLYRLNTVLDDALKTDWPPAVLALKLLILTGMRREEVLRLRWDEVDVASKRINLTTAKTGARAVPVSAAAIEVLEELRKFSEAVPGPYVIPSPKDRSKPFVGLPKLWQKLRARAGLAHVRIHDLRHNFGGVGAAATRSATHVKTMLGHSNIATSDRYMKLAENPINQAVDEVGEALREKMQPANVVSLGSRR